MSAVPTNIFTFDFAALAAFMPATTQQLENLMSTLDDLNNAVAALQTAVNNAITLIQSLHTGAGTVTDAEVETVVGELQAASTALSGAKPQP